MSSKATSDLLDEIRSLPPKDRLRIVESIVHGLAADADLVSAQQPENVVGLFSDEPELLDQVAEEALVARERDPLRRSGA
jgi:hypothetical protein